MAQSAENDNGIVLKGAAKLNRLGSISRAAAVVVTGAAVMLLLSACGMAVQRQSNLTNVLESSRKQGASAVQPLQQPLAADETNAAAGTDRTAGRSPARSHSESDKHKHQQFIERLHQLVRQGRMVNAGRFVVGKTRIDEVHRQWGMPNRIEGGYHYYYPGMMKGVVAFGVGRGKIIKEIRIADLALDPMKDGVKLKVSEVRAAFGQPDSVKRHGRKKRLIYSLEEYKLRFEYNPTSSQNPELEWISIISPWAARLSTR
ncbi:DUF4309 domain-containing protein [Paenibacillus xylaniclasticus]|uniref:DUF4309 domain-containing protein n=1 Tax=Paenibacillus xylaniclasticus TaxID=588083 RepID=UPI0013DF2CEF|nr:MULTISPECIES: DUF4309 domain-containing protein [Paenibacillus]